MEKSTYTASNISKAFGPTLALEDVSVAISSGTIMGLVGVNGAGKSTLMRILAGATAPDSGRLSVDGNEVSFASTSDALAAGVAIVSQELSLFPALTVEENLRFMQGRRHWRSSADFRKSAKEILQRLGFAFRLTDRVADLGLADRQLVEIARALLQNPRVLILDEPTSALHAADVDRLHNQLRRLRDAGVAIVYVSHFLEDLLDICDQIVVLRNGKSVACPDLSQPDKLSRLVAAMLGDTPVPERKAEIDQKSGDKDRRLTSRPLSISGLRGRRLKIDNLSARPGEIVGLAGLMGSGVSELFSILFGLQRARSGIVKLPSDLPIQYTPADAVRAGVAYVPPDRKNLGLMQRQTIGENVVSVRLLAQGRDGFVPDLSELSSLAEKRCNELGVRMSSVRQIVGTLSGGNQQKVVFAKWLEANPSLFLLDDPTRGIDIRARFDIHEIVRYQARSGAVILYYSSDPAEIVQIADRINVFVDGILAHELSGDRMTEHNLITLMNSGVEGQVQAAASYSA